MTSRLDKTGPSVALVSIGIGRVRRGYERYFQDLFDVLHDEVDITLFKSGGSITSRERIPRLLRAVTAAVRLLPLGKGLPGAEYRTYRHDCLAYALCLLPVLLLRKFDIVHVIDHPLAQGLQMLRRLMPFRARLLFTNGWGATPEVYPRVDRIHHIAQPLYDHALEDGVDPSTLAMVPCGIHTARFRTSRGRRTLRLKYDVPVDTFVILVVSALNRHHKRIDHVIEEISRVDGDLLLWIDGNPEDLTLRDLARDRLGDRCRITHVASSAVPDLYAVADVMVHAALKEAFGLVLIEAIATGLPVLAHDAEHFRWLIEDEDHLLDMSASGALAARLRVLMQQRDELDAGSDRRASRAIERFDWGALCPRYLTMYREVAARGSSNGPVRL